MYDYLIVGAGLFGATVAWMLTERGASCLVVDRRGQVAGNVYTEQVEGIHVHKYGAHIFHTNDASVWAFVQRSAWRFWKQLVLIFLHCEKSKGLA